VPTETAVPPTFTPLPSETPSPTNTAAPPPTVVPLPTVIITTTVRCEDRLPDENLLSIVSKTFGISREYEPIDLTALSDHFPHEVTLGYPSEVRSVIIEPLVAMVNDMLAAGLQPQILSGYRSSIAQSIAFDKWLREYPDRAAILSAPPGHSEHQLGTTVDFGSPELPEIVGEPGIQFHTHFYMTSESVWLAENAHRYGFTLSFPREAFEITGFAYEPWHYRYVGVEMATQLKELGITLTEYLLITEPAPCIPYQS
jgi:D-alanyl-D-alanine carboxypeptidase